MDSPSSAPYASAVAFSCASLIVTLLITPPLIWHAQNRNVGATILVALAIVGNFQSFLNAIIWSNDDYTHWYSGVGLCDIEVKVQSFQAVAFPASVFCILKDLARTLDTGRTVLMQTESQKRRAMTIDLLCCIGFPLFQIPLHFIVQPVRYYLMGIAGCVIPISTNWVWFTLMSLPVILWLIADAYLAALVLTRLIRYRIAFRELSSSTAHSKSRFIRLYALCLISMLGLIPLEIYILKKVGFDVLFQPFSWNAVHSSSTLPWNSYIMVKSNGHVFFDRWIWLSGGVVIFLLFGIGKEAIKSYRKVLTSLGLGRMVSRINKDCYAVESQESGRTWSPLRRKGSGVTSTIDSTISDDLDKELESSMSCVDGKNGSVVVERRV